MKFLINLSNGLQSRFSQFRFEGDSVSLTLHGNSPSIWYFTGMFALSFHMQHNIYLHHLYMLLYSFNTRSLSFIELNITNPHILSCSSFFNNYLPDYFFFISFFSFSYFSNILSINFLFLFVSFYNLNSSFYYSLW